MSGNPSINLWAVSFQCDVKYGDRSVPFHEVLLTARNEEEAAKQAVEWFLKDGPWTSVALDLNARPTADHIRGVKTVQLTSILAYGPHPAMVRSKSGIGNIAVINFR